MFGLIASQKPQETWEEEVQNLIKNKLGMADEIEVDHCHSIQKFQRNSSKPQIVVGRVQQFKYKENVFPSAKKLKNTGIYEDYLRKQCN